ncbi:MULTISPECIES: acyl-CoA dehydrogenase family protein [unclassified Frankia]|uniref:acyl-CoA dehydrogenase family protein n=3 Tax=Frankia TaxID=1854 RepID=UPI002AD48A97|nr:MULTISPECIES: acyl-CoA dehydrogenase family protein [unclassified Frankia]
MTVDTRATTAGAPAPATEPATGSDDRREELASLRDTVAQACLELGGPALARGLGDDGPGFDEHAWEILGREIGLACLGLPAEAGGAGDLAELVTVAEVLGAHLLPVPFLSSTVLAGQVLAGTLQAGAAQAGTGGSAAASALARVAAGDVAALAVTDADGRWRPDRLQVTFQNGSGAGTSARVTLDGVAPFVLDAPGARSLVVAAVPQPGGGPDLFLVDTDEPGVDVTRLDTLDLTRAQAQITFTGAVATRLTHGATAAATVGPALDTAGVVLAAEQLGGAQACLDMTVAYVKERRQFGRPIGGFQAVKHLCADLLVLVEMSRSAVDRALLAAGTPAFTEAAAVAQAWCSDAFRRVSAETVQLHGGIGFTWEHDAHLYFRRARADAVLLGGAAHHREQIAAVLGW